MTTATTEVKAWTPEQESQIAKLMETEGLSRPQAIRKMKAGSNSAVKSAPAPKAKSAAKPKKAKGASDCHLSEAKKEEVTKLVS
jgi:hypothetical protein